MEKIIEINGKKYKAIKENKYSVTVNMGRKVGDIKLQVNAKDEKEARALIAKGLKNPKDIKKVVKEGK
jgi:hypothetical protein